MAFLRWLAFALYLLLLVCVPLALLWNLSGILVGALFTLVLLLIVRFRGTQSLIQRLRARPLTHAEAPALYQISQEYCRRLNLRPPQLCVTESRALNAAVFGFSTHDTHLVFTQGLLDSFSRARVAAVVARMLCLLKSGEVSNETWLARFFSVFEKFTDSKKSKHPGLSTHSLPLRRMARQVLLYPVTLFPTFVLKSARDEKQLDEISVHLTRDPNALAEALREMDAYTERIPFHPPFSVRHLFLAPPVAGDPLTRIFFSSPELSRRIKKVELLGQTAGPA